jgi:predicted GNAT superfamily acetyltransferase
VRLPPELVASAVREAADRSRRAGVDIRAIERPEEISALSRLFGEIWNVPNRELGDRDLLVAMAHAGNYVVGACDADRLVGACVGFFGEPLGDSLHSHIAGVSSGLDGRGIGTALKYHQRAWCLQHGIGQITWTFDPLIARNAAFNLNRLGVRIEDYLVEFYGQMNDGRNLGQASDRVWVVWDLAARRSPITGTPSNPVLAPASDGSPRQTEPTPPADLLSVSVPSDVEALRRTDPPLAERWRYALREVMTELIGAGWVVTGFDRATSSYLFTKGDRQDDRSARIAAEQERDA